MKDNVYEESDFVEVVDKDTDQKWPDPIPKQWIGTDLAPNVKQVSSSRSQSSRSGDQGGATS